MKVLGWVFGAIHIVGYCGLGLLFLWIEWLYIASNWIQFFNPILHFQVLWTMITTPLTWILLVCSAGGFFASVGVEKIKEDM